MGGGHGLAASLSALRYLPGEITAVVTVADNGGSSGRLRTELGVLPPGDLRKALAALCGEDEWGQTWAQVLQYRFDSGGELSGHALGNLLIVSLWDLLGDHVAGLDWIGRLLGSRGRVLPMSSIPLDIEATVRQGDGGLTVVRGQAEVATAPGDVVSVRLEPVDPPASPPAPVAVREADWVVVGPGSWFTSVIPNLLVPELSRALHETSAQRMLVLNLEAQPGETEGFSPERHLEVIAEHAPRLGVDVVLADRDAVADEPSLRAAADDLGAELVLDRLARDDGSARHDPLRLAAAYDRIMRVT
ncbi:uridine diphosphate-N-acetylglucosamine-binding protein YvcK [Mumia sp. zg.B53]|uniref:gluconeogenesis factor YvcK family protein n=1 Tax=unclassified Mumia TaxID=2621872 RepID=UPI001C6EA2F6|nr:MULTISPECIES: uridine diphosphate-N-acetylglucosamine-binding protein YvcK [unclassified Mumia]MBW9205239.1 uridine diphosphate-N-acetylglucosamine-binding protein YvcK [Mumia sp. zg.B17]MBW9208764.1 uridine diphosphate-N-acetylglucosamine-binding protein YvcK [Mumia sp. zg.B21]MBW9213375.1 uridine diphosphate-N-acetylglucosamine-binding protein YvcK [Mumia sp. zg.B53]MDD9349885.1 uridine diphosphate-N-acetylglucosamine-binding protein YvcK [Mumia sp.]